MYSEFNIKGVRGTTSSSTRTIPSLRYPRSARSVEVTQSNANNFLDYVLKRIEFLSLEVAPDKTEAILFRGRRRLDYPDLLVRVKRSFVRVSQYIKYLWVMLDVQLNYRLHFSYMDNKIGKVTRALGRLMPNLRGPEERKRRLYAGIVHSVVLYAAPIWADSLNVEVLLPLAAGHRSLRRLPFNIF